MYDYFLIIKYFLLSLEEQTCELRSCVDQYQWQQKLLWEAEFRGLFVQTLK